MGHHFENFRDIHQAISMKKPRFTLTFEALVERVVLAKACSRRADRGFSEIYLLLGNFGYSKRYLSLGAVFAVFSGFYYWIGKIVGVQYPEILGKIHFWSTFFGVNLTFGPHHFLGLSGMPRRIPLYPDAYSNWNSISTLGSYISLISSIFFIIIIWITLTLGSPVPNNPWNFQIKKSNLYSTTLEWLLPSPPQYHTFKEVPIIKEIFNNYKINF